MNGLFKTLIIDVLWLNLYHASIYERGPCVSTQKICPRGFLPFAIIDTIV